MSDSPFSRQDSHYKIQEILFRVSYDQQITLAQIAFSDKQNITKTSPCNEDPCTSHFYIVKLGGGGYRGMHNFPIFTKK